MHTQAPVNSLGERPYELFMLKSIVSKQRFAVDYLNDKGAGITHDELKEMYQLYSKHKTTTMFCVIIKSLTKRMGSSLKEKYVGRFPLLAVLNFDNIQESLTDDEYAAIVMQKHTPSPYRPKSLPYEIVKSMFTQMLDLNLETIVNELNQITPGSLSFKLPDIDPNVSTNQYSDRLRTSSEPAYKRQRIDTEDQEWLYGDDAELERIEPLELLETIRVPEPREPLVPTDVYDDELEPFQLQSELTQIKPDGGQKEASGSHTPVDIRFEEEAAYTHTPDGVDSAYTHTPLGVDSAYTHTPVGVADAHPPSGADASSSRIEPHPFENDPIPAPLELLTPISPSTPFSNTMDDSWLHFTTDERTDKDLDLFDHQEPEGVATTPPIDLDRSLSLFEEGSTAPVLTKPKPKRTKKVKPQ